MGGKFNKTEGKKLCHVIWAICSIPEKYKQAESWCLQKVKQGEPVKYELSSSSFAIY